MHKYGRVPIYTDGAGWYADACRWVGAEHFVYGHPLKNPISAERVIQYVKEGTEVFDDLFPVGKRRLTSGRPSSACSTGSQNSCSCRTSFSITGT